jgi:ABC-type glycerol-3-phosphate transport system permease component
MPAASNFLALSRLMRPSGVEKTSMKRRHTPTDLVGRLLAGPVVWIGLTLLTAFALGPFLWMLLTSLKDRQELYATPLQYLPAHPTFENYIEAWTSPVTPFSRFFLDSLWMKG